MAIIFGLIMILVVVVGLLAIGFLAGKNENYRQNYKTYGAIYLFSLVGFFFFLAFIFELLGFHA